MAYIKKSRGRSDNSGSGISSGARNRDYGTATGERSNNKLPIDFGSDFGQVTSSGAAVSAGVLEDWLGRDVANLGGAFGNLQQSNNFADFLAGLVSQGTLSEELQALILQAATQYGMAVDQRAYDQMVTKDQRQYEYALLQDQRLYNTPTNELARLMGAGISRDAAIQMLSGGSAGSGGVSTSGAVTNTPPSVQPMQTPGTVANQTAANAINGVNAIMNLVSTGISLPIAVNQARLTSAQNYMSQAQVKAFQGVNDIVNAFDTAVFNGTLSVDDVQFLRNADDYYRWITDHADTNMIKPLIQNGSVNAVFGSTFGRQFLNHHLDETRNAKDAGRIFDSYVKQSEAAARLADFDADKAYYDVQYAIGELSKQDVAIQNLWNDVWLGNINIELAGKELSLKSYEVNQADLQNDVFNAVYRQNYGDGSPDLRNLGTGARFLAYSQWDELSRMFTRAFAMSGTSERRDAWEKFYLDNTDALKLMAGIKRQMTFNQSQAMNPDEHPNLAALISLYQIGNLTGAFDLIGFGAEVGEKIGLINALNNKK